MSDMGFYYANLTAGILLGIVGQLALKSAAVEATTITTQFLNPLTMIGFALYVVAAICYILALRKIPVSTAFPSVAASYAVVAVLAHFLWNEPLGWHQIAGILLIGSGVLLIHQH
jgi:small multidrug resistance pump